mgnify:CR=1 FL=1
MSKKEDLTEKDIKQIFQMYKNAHRLKTILRTGWSRWGLDKKIRYESVAEHIYGCCMLALSIFANGGAKNLNVDKVFTMLVLHETEEIFIGDITPFDKKVVHKKELGKRAVKKFFRGAPNADYFLKIIEEYEANETEEAKFARRIDKLEADIQAKYYDRHFIRKINQRVLKNERIMKYKSMGYTKVSDFFILYDKHIFDDYFLKLLEYLENDDEIDKEYDGGEKQN